MSARIDGLKPLLLSALAAVAIAACGGAAATTGPGGPAASSGAGTQAPAGSTQAPAGGQATQQPAGGPTVDACTLLTGDDIRAVTGYEVATARASASNMVFPSGCEWELVAPNEMVPPSIALGIMTVGGKAYYDTYFAPFNDEQGNTPIAGLGDTAVDVGFGAVMVVKGDNLFNLQYLGELDHEVELAKKLVTHL